MKKSEVFVKINNKRDAKNAERILEALGEDISISFYNNREGENSLLLNRDWTVAYAGASVVDNRKEVTLKELIQIIANEQEEKPKELEFNKWYKYNGWLIFYTGVVGGVLKGYGFDNDFNWKDTVSFGNNENHALDNYKGIVLATNEEVFEALKNEAINRGFKCGVTVKNHQGENKLPHFDFNNIKNGLFNDGIYYDDKKTGIWLVYQGKWAEIIEQPKEIILFEDTDWKSIVTKNGFLLRNHKDNYNEAIHNGIFTSGEELEQIYKAYKSLN